MFSARHSVARVRPNVVVFMVAACWGPRPARATPSFAHTHSSRPPRLLSRLRPPHPPPLQPEWANARSFHAGGQLRPGGTNGRPGQKTAKPQEAQHLCTALFRKRAPDRRAARPLRAHAPQPPTLALHANTTASCPLPPRTPRPSPLTSSASSRAHAHLSSPGEGAETVSLARSRGGGGGQAGIPEFPFSPPRIKMRVLKLSWFLFYFFFPFFQYTSLSFKKRDIKKKEKKTKMFKKKNKQHPHLCLYIAS